MNKTYTVFRHGKHIEVQDLELPTSGKLRRTREPFVKVPLEWVIEAAKAARSPRALVLIDLLHCAWKAKGPTFSLPNGWLQEHGVGRNTKYRVLRDLEAARMITVERQPRKSPTITLVTP